MKNETYRYVGNTLKTTTLVNILVLLLVLLSPKVKSNGFVDVGFTNEVETVNSLFRVKGNYFVSAGNDYVGVGIGHRFTHAVVVGGYNSNKIAYLTVIARPDNTPIEYDVTYRDNLEDTKPKVELGLNYFIWEKVALRVSSDFNQVFIGIRRSI